MFHCPHCHSIIYSRRSGRCGVCEAELPENLHLTEEQRAKIEEQMMESENNHREMLSHLDRVTEHERLSPF
jgi:uncharacterized Zn finger protein (UPF0148 family)